MELTATTVLLFLGSMIFLTVNFVAGNGLSLLVKGASGFSKPYAPQNPTVSFTYQALSYLQVDPQARCQLWSSECTDPRCLQDILLELVSGERTDPPMICQLSACVLWPIFIDLRTLRTI
jgi:hypothetical protein